MLGEKSDGVKHGGAWLVFASEHGDLEPAFALDRRFVDTSRQPWWQADCGAGTYHQDMVCHESLGDDEVLWDGAPGFVGWFAGFLEGVQEALTREDPDTLRKQVQLLVTEPTTRPQTWEALWARIQEQHSQRGRYGLNWRRVLAESDDLVVVPAFASSRVLCWRVARANSPEGSGVVVPAANSMVFPAWCWTSATSMPTGPLMVTLAVDKYDSWGPTDDELVFGIKGSTLDAMWAMNVDSGFIFPGGDVDHMVFVVDEQLDGEELTTSASSSTEPS